MAFLEVFGVRIECVRHHPADVVGAPTLVFLHEGLGSVAAWRDFPARLAREVGCPAFVYSRRGYGLSAPLDGPFTSSFMHDEALRTLPALLDEAGIADPILVGHSDGASIALIHAAASGRRVRALVLEAPHVVVEDETVASIRAVRERYRDPDFRTRWSRTQGPNADATFASWTDVWLDPAFRAWTIEDLLPRVSCRVFVAQGEDDEYGTERQVESIRSRVAGPVEAHLLPACGHAPHRDRPEPVLALVRPFLSGARV